MSFRRYERYKNAGIGWLSEVPAHWRVMPNKALLRATSDLVGANSSDFTLLSLTLFGVIVRDIESGKGKFPAEFDSYKAVEANDLIFCLFDLDETPRTIGLANQSGMITGAYEVLRCRPLAQPSYVCYFYLHVDGSKGLRPWYTGLRKVVRPDTFMSIKLALPLLDEQEAISLFLDKETAKIDALIEEQRRLIELLKEKRQAVISHAVTKGLNPDVKMKGTRFEWLGTVPAPWEVVPIKWVAKIESGHTPDKKVDAYWEGGDIPWISLNDTGYLRDNDYITETAYYTTLAGLENSSAHLLSARAVVFSRDATIGRCAITTRPMAVSQHFIAWICGDRVLPEYLLQVCHTMRTELERLSTGATIKTIGMTDINSLAMPLPPLPEQLRIVEHIRQEIPSIDTLIAESQRAHNLLQERRSAVISAAVTGKIDVRNYTPKEAA